MNRAFALTFLLLTTVVLLNKAGSAQATPPISPGTQEIFEKSLVDEPVFQGKVFILEGGKEHSQSVVLVPGLGDLGAGTWENLLPILAQHFHVIAFDLPGFGFSEKKNALYSPERYAASLNWLVDRYVDGPFHLIGHSLGGSIALHYAATRPKNLRKLILADVAGLLHKAVLTRHFLQPDLSIRWPLTPGSPQPIVDHLIESTVLGLEGLPLDPQVLLKNRELRAGFLGSDPAKIAALALAVSNYSAVLPRVATPTLILWGEEDRTTPLRIGILLEGALKNARLARIPQAGHMLMLDQADRFNREVLAFLAAPPPQPPLHPVPGDRTAVFEDRTGLTLQGNYQSIKLIRCRNTRLIEVTAASVKIVDSTVNLQQCRIKGPKTGLLVQNSTVTATALTVEADLALAVSRSTLDLAGARLKGESAAVHCGDQSTILFSVSQAESPISRVYLHGKWNASPQNPL